MSSYHNKLRSTYIKGAFRHSGDVEGGEENVQAQFDGDVRLGATVVRMVDTVVGVDPSTGEPITEPTPTTQQVGGRILFMRDDTPVVLTRETLAHLANLSDDVQAQLNVRPLLSDVQTLIAPFATYSTVSSGDNATLVSAKTYTDTQTANLADRLDVDAQFVSFASAFDTKLATRALQTDVETQLATRALKSDVDTRFTTVLSYVDSRDAATAGYVDTQVATRPTLAAVLANNNAFTGTCTFNTALPTSTLTPSTNTQLTTKTYVDTQVATKTTLAAVQANNNAFTGTCTFNTVLPTSTLTPSTNAQLTTKTYVDTQIAALNVSGGNTSTLATANAYTDTQVATRTTLAAVLANNNAFTGTCTFNTALPTSTLTPTTNTQFTTKTYVDTQIELYVSGVNLYTLDAANTYTDAAVGPLATWTSLLSGDATTLASAKTYTDTQVATRTTLAAVLANNNAFTGTCTFNTALPTSTLTPTTASQLTTKTYVDAADTTTLTSAKAYTDTQVATRTTLAAVLANNNAFTGTCTFNTVLPTSTLTPTTASQLTTKTYVDTQVATKTTLAAVLANNNAFTGTCTFNTALPTSTLTPSTAAQLTTKTYVDNQVATRTTLAAVLANNNAFTGTCTFNTALPTSTLTPTAATQLTTKTYVDTADATTLASAKTYTDTQVATRTTLAAVLANNNAFTGTCTFNTVLPTSTLTPTTASQLTTKSYVDAAVVPLTGVTYTASTNKTYIDHEFGVGSHLTSEHAWFNYNIRLGQVGGSTYLKNDLRLCNVANKNEGEFSQIYQAGPGVTLINQVNNGNFTFTTKDSTGTNLNALAIQSANVTVGSPLVASNTVTLNKPLTVNDTVTFAKVPTCSVAPTSSNDLVNFGHLINNYMTSANADLYYAALRGNNFFTGMNSFLGLISSPQVATALGLMQTLMTYNGSFALTSAYNIFTTTVPGFTTNQPRIVRSGNGVYTANITNTTNVRGVVVATPIVDASTPAGATIQASLGNTNTLVFNCYGGGSNPVKTDMKFQFIVY